jgi:hypothetical protein
MKRSVRFFFVLLISWGVAGAVLAQTSAKQAAKDAAAAALKNKIESQQFTFVAQYIQPLRGIQHYLTDDYDLRVKKDSVIAYLPYIGRVYMDVPIYPDDDGVMFSSTRFNYLLKPKKKGGWTVTINLNDVKRSSKLQLDVSSSGSAYLMVTSNTRDQVAFLGYIKEDKK